MTVPTSLDLLAEFESAKKTAQALFRRAAKTMPSAVGVTQQAIQEALGDPPYDVAHIKDNFSALVYDLQMRAYGLYLEAERRACGPILAEYVFSSADDWHDEGQPRSFSDSFFVLDRFCLSLTQSRRTRAGAAFETVVTTLFEALGYPYTAQPELSGSKPDFVLPSVSHYQAFVSDCVIFTFNTALRKRSHYVITEELTGKAFFLATMDKQLSGAELERLKSRRVRVVVPGRIKSKCYSSALNVIDFESFFKYHLDPAINRWKAYGVI